jgi:hypothetical protein
VKRLLVLSVHAADAWHLYRWQAWYLSRTTEDYDHVVISQNRPPEFVTSWRPCFGPKHIAGLRQANQCIVELGRKYQACCILDSDAFPIRADWQDTLDSGLRRFNKEFAAPVRTENFDLFPHISCLYARPDFPFGQFLRSGWGQTLGGSRRDVAAHLPIRRCFPLLKSNVWTPHPQWHTVYGDLIYHRGAGTRDAKQKNAKVPRRQGAALWQHLMPDADVNCRQDAPTPEFVNRLVGQVRFGTNGFPAQN